MHCGIEDQITSPIDKTLLDRLQDRINWAQEIIFVWFQLSMKASESRRYLLEGVARRARRSRNPLIDAHLVKKRTRKKFSDCQGDKVACQTAARFASML